jgi:hypothetical protein
MNQPVDEANLLGRLEAEYDLDQGFLGRLRRGQFDPSGLGRLLSLLRTIDFGEAVVLNRRMVALLWLIPTLMTWQLERVAEQGGDTGALRRATDQVRELLAAPSVLGMP